MNFELKIVLLILCLVCILNPANGSAIPIPAVTESPDLGYETTELLIVETTIVSEADNFPRSLDSIENDTTSAPSLTEDTTILLEPTPNQEEVLTELQDIWNYSENLDESESELRTRLTSLVHLTYGRLQTEPEETLDRLKYLLKKLRSTLIQAGTDGSSNSTSLAHSRKARSLLNDLELLYGIGEVENVLNPEDYVKHHHSVVQKASSPLPPPLETTIQKILRVEDIVRSTTAIPTTSSGTPLRSLRTTTAHPVTAEQIASSILKLLNKNYNEGPTVPTASTTRTTPSTTTAPPTTTQTPPYLIPILNGYKDESALDPSFEYFQEYMKKVRRKLKEREKLRLALKYYEELKRETSTTSAQLPLPSYFMLHNPNLIVAGEAENEIEPTFHQKPTETTTASSGPATLLKRRASTSTSASYPSTDYDPLLEGSDAEASSAPAIANLIEEMSAGNVVLTPVSLFNGTREGVLTLVTTFNTFRFSTKMVLLFLLSVSVLSIALGVYSLGPPIIAVGALGILIPIILFILLQNDERRGSGLELKAGDGTHELDNVLDLISVAIKKYGVDN